MTYADKKGSSLVEFIVYLVLFAWITHLTFAWSTRIVIQCTTLDQQCSQRISCFLIYDALCKDLASAEKKASGWKAVSLQELFFETPTKTIAWHIDAAGITRTEGVYNRDIGKWIAAKKAHFSSDITRFTYTLEQRDFNIVRVMFTVGTPENSLHGIVSPAGVYSL